MSKIVYDDEFFDKYKIKLKDLYGYSDDLLKSICNSIKKLSSFYGTEYMEDICLKLSKSDYRLVEEKSDDDILYYGIYTLHQDANLDRNDENFVSKTVFSKIKRDLDGENYEIDPTIDGILSHDMQGEVLREFLIKGYNPEMEDVMNQIVDRLSEYKKSKAI